MTTISGDGTATSCPANSTSPTLSVPVNIPNGAIILDIRTWVTGASSGKASQRAGGITYTGGNITFEVYNNDSSARSWTPHATVVYVA